MRKVAGDFIAGVKIASVFKPINIASNAHDALGESLLAERGKRALRETLRGLRENYTVRVEGRAAPTQGGG